ncbi:MAG TPA: GTP-binding protein [Herbaspirillum sp.]|nr:GTP-binding protein [Herbaspirillum sp.]
MSDLIPVTIVTGFLGSGKTTLLAGLIRGRQSRRLALLINEFGEVSVDGALIREAVATAEEADSTAATASGVPQIRIDELPHGLIAYGDDALFLPVMKAIAARRANIDHVIIETSGLALPSAAMALLQGPLLADAFVLDATLAVVDTPLLLAGQFDAATETESAAASAAPVAALFDQQLAWADVVVLNKIDALDEAALLRAEGAIRARAPNVRFLELAYRAELNIRLALGLRLHQVTGNAAALKHAHAPVYTPWQGNQDGMMNGHAHSGIGAHSHGLATHRHFHQQDPGWLSFTLRSDAAQSLPQLQQALAEAARQEPILRSKGFVYANEQRGPVLVQGVRARITLAEDTKNDVSNADNTASQQSELVFIGYHASRARVAGLLSAITATDWS